jgi:hypothetical protein
MEQFGEHMADAVEGDDENGGPQHLNRLDWVM